MGLQASSGELRFRCPPTSPKDKVAKLQTNSFTGLRLHTDL